MAWAESCPYQKSHIFDLHRLGEGSEHIVYFESSTDVIKVTRPGVFGDQYYLDDDGRINQENCSPFEYLTRLRIWKKIFRTAPADLGITREGQIVPRQPFIVGKKPIQPTVDKFLLDSGLLPVKQRFWLWKKDYEGYEVWIGDAREDNFVETPAGLVPIDIRIWFVENGGPAIAE